MARNLGAALTHTITAYEAETAETLAYSAVRFQQRVIVDGERIVHHCVATIVWKCIVDDWRQIRWQCAIERTEVVGAGDPEAEEESP